MTIDLTWYLWDITKVSVPPKDGRSWEYIFSRFTDPALLEKLVEMVYDLPPPTSSYPTFLSFHKNPLWPFQFP